MRAIGGRGTLLCARVAALSGLFAAGFGSGAEAQLLGTAADYGVLAGSTVTNTGPSVIQGNVGVSPGLAVVGFPPGIVVAPGTINAGNAAAAQAQIDLTTAYNTLQGLPADVDLTGQDLGGLVLSPAVYAFSASAQLTGLLTLDGQGNSAAQFVFQIGSALTTASNSAVLLINGTNGDNVYWQVGSSATLGTNSVFAGNIVALTSITLNTGANITCGRALARNGAVTLDNTTITLCVAGDDDEDDDDITEDDLGGGGLTAAQQAALNASGLFGSAMLGQAAFWRDTPAQPQDLGSLKDGPGDPNLEASFIQGYQPRTRRVWATGFGGNFALDGQQGNPLSDQDSRTWGFASGLDTQIDHSTLVGIAGGYSHSTFSVDGRLTSGTIEGMQVGLYGVKRVGAFYLAGAAHYAHFDNETNRFIDWVIDEWAEGDYSSDQFAGQMEAGWTKNYGATNVAPFVGLNVTHARDDGFTEDSETLLGAPGILGLTVASQSWTSVSSALGIQIDSRIALTNGRTITPFARVAWVHEFNPDRSIDSFLTLSPAAAFSLDGVRRRAIWPRSIWASSSTSTTAWRSSAISTASSPIAARPTPAMAA